MTAPRSRPLLPAPPGSSAWIFCVNNRVVGSPMPRAAVGEWDEETGSYTLTSPTQGVIRVQNSLANNVLKVPKEQLRVISPDVGGGFGLRGKTFPESALVLFAARRLEAPGQMASPTARTRVIEHHRLALDVQLGETLGLFSLIHLLPPSSMTLGWITYDPLPKLELRTQSGTLAMLIVAGYRPSGTSSYLPIGPRPVHRIMERRSQRLSIDRGARAQRRGRYQEFSDG